MKNLNYIIFGTLWPHLAVPIKIGRIDDASSIFVTFYHKKWCKCICGLNEVSESFIKFHYS